MPIEPEATYTLVFSVTSTNQGNLYELSFSAICTPKVIKTSRLLIAAKQKLMSTTSDLHTHMYLIASLKKILSILVATKMPELHISKFSMVFFR